MNKEKLQTLLGKFSNAKKFVWFQEEPQNMGAWSFIFQEFVDLLPENQSLHYVGRPKSASPATGSFSLHNREQIEIIETVLAY